MKKNDSVTFNSIQLSCVPGSIAECLDIIPPDNARVQIPELLELTKDEKAQKLLLYTPSPFTVDDLKALPEESIELLLKMPVSVDLVTCYPPNAQSSLYSMYTGIWVESHKELLNERRNIIHTDTLFDSFLRANKKTVVITHSDSAIQRVFVGKNILFICEKNSEDMLEKTLSLIEENIFDVIVVYEKDLMIRDNPAHRALHVFSSLYGAVSHCWGKTRNLVAFAPDRAVKGQPIFRHNNRPSPTELNITHYYSIIDNRIQEPEVKEEYIMEELPI